MKIVIAPDKFAGTLSAAEAAAAVAVGWRAARPRDELVLVPMADGGEGTLEVVAGALPAAQRQQAEVADATGHAVLAQWLRLPDGTALVEAALACGLSPLTTARRDPKAATSYGVGQLVRAATTPGVHRVVVAVGGTATVDGGAGMSLALGHRLLRSDGNGVKVGAQHLRELATVRPGPPLQVPVVAATDVRNPLLGRSGAARVYGPQKGASSEDVAVLETALAHYADVVERDLTGGPWRDVEGAGAGGGLGFGLAAFCRAHLLSGAELVGAMVGLPPALEGADVVVTGEGALDAQTAAGKVPAYVAALARRVGAVSVAVVGRASGNAGAMFDVVAELGQEGLVRPRELVELHAAEVADGIAALRTNPRVSELRSGNEAR